MTAQKTGFLVYSLVATVLVFTGMVLLSHVWNLRQVDHETTEVARTMARAAFFKDVLYRRWNAKHGGVYGPVSADTAPNPYLAHMTERDLTTPSGRRLTLINPAYMTRQVHELGEKSGGVLGHITSLNPIRPENRADPWEVEALEAFEGGATEYSVVQEVAGRSYMRLMRPLVTEEGCLSCHAAQGYEVGDIRGGISASVPLGPLQESLAGTRKAIWASHSAFWLIGIAFIGLAFRRARLSLMQMERYQQELEDRVAERTDELTEANQSLEAEISERKKAEAQLEQQHGFLRSVLETLTHPFFVLDVADFTVKMSNSAAGFGSLAAKRKCFDLIHGRTEPCDGLEHQCPIVEVTRTKQPMTVEHVHTHDGEPRTFEIHAYPLLDGEGNVVQVIEYLLDITERKQAQMDLDVIITELEAKNAELERFTYTVSHDLRSPLITIKGFLGHVERAALAGNAPQMKADLARISDAAEQMEQLLEELLVLSRIGRVINEPVEVPLTELARQALDLLAGRLAEWTTEVEIAPDLPVVFGDRRRLLEMLENLIDNAVKFSRHQPNPRVEIGSRTEGEETIFFVRDNGVGIDPSSHERVFGLFERLDQDFEGTGVGLAIVKRIVEVHEGRIWVESQGAGKGATFYFTLPGAHLQ